MVEKKEKQKRMQVLGEKYEPMLIETFRKLWIKKGYDLVDVTKLCEFNLGCSGWCNDFNEPDENIYHIQVMYRDICIGTFHPSTKQPNWNEKYVVFIFEDEDFIIFRKVKIEDNKNENQN